MGKKTCNVKINGTNCQAEEGINLVEACLQQGIIIPTLCYLKDLNESGACSVCLVEVKGAKTLLRACVTKVRDGMEIYTDTERIRRARKVVVELILANHPKDCLGCEKNQNCDLQRIAYELGIENIRYPKTRQKDFSIDNSSPSIIRDPNKCILCGRCIEVCSKIQEVNAIDFIKRGHAMQVSTFFDGGLGNSECTNCGQCVLVCPTGALAENNSIGEVWRVLDDKEQIVIVQTAPAIRAAIGEAFGFNTGVPTTGKLAASLRRLGFSKIFDTQFAADLTIIEEGSEFLTRLKNNDKIPTITSCSPGWIKFGETFFPGILDNISTCKSPQQMFGAIAKTYYAQKMNIDPRKIKIISVMPCTAKKFEALRPEINSAFSFWKDKLALSKKEYFPDVDYVLTTRELIRMIKEAGIDYANLADEGFDDPLGVSTGAATIFGASGGVMEAALRSAYFYLTGTELKDIELNAVRGLSGIKEASLEIAGKKIKVAVAHGLGNARKLMQQVARGESPYHFIEIMACPGGCIGGGGQPLPVNDEIRKLRIKALYQEDRSLAYRRSHQNPAVIKLYSEFLKKPNGHLSHKLLHTHYHKRQPVKI
ncbi:MAG: NADH-dependent [FeFe] hydrogenase, group A6 [Candidatus Omnitrophica bacterium]|nr:NADH-dependent [FeFe] hydrogenase, group A6 [Candidatus Omnitrophota bacterium]MDD5429106.1 NADH-dependent [FeFe] hydrogenase, group A6 [Candidatus Omnitrophota bacterium]